MAAAWHSLTTSRLFSVMDLDQAWVVAALQGEWTAVGREAEKGKGSSVHAAHPQVLG